MSDKPRSLARAPTLTEVAVFPAAADFRTWLEANHDSATDLWVGYYKKMIKPQRYGLPKE